VEVRGEEVEIVWPPWIPEIIVVSYHRTSPGQTGYFTHSSYNDIFFLSATGSTANYSIRSEHFKRRTNNDPRRDIRRRTITKWKLYG
jgi:hypothetical protein